MLHLNFNHERRDDVGNKLLKRMCCLIYFSFFSLLDKLFVCSEYSESLIMLYSVSDRCIFPTRAFQNVAFKQKLTQTLVIYQPF